MSRGVIYKGCKVNGNLRKTILKTILSEPETILSEPEIILSEPETDTYDLRTFPDDFVWTVPGSTSYSIQESSGAGFSSFSITGEAVNGSRQLEGTKEYTGDKDIVVRVFWNDSCADHGLAIFDNKNYWTWDKNSNRISVQSNCGNFTLYGRTQLVVSGSTMTTGNWYTYVMEHRPSLNKTTCKLILGTDKNAEPVTTVTVNESYTGTYKVGLAADQDDTINLWSQFADLEINPV